MRSAFPLGTVTAGDLLLIDNGVTSLLVASHDEHADMALQNSHAEGW